MIVATQKGFATATDLADYLAKKGLPFRDAHEVVGKSVAFAIKQRVGLVELSLEKFQEFSELIEADVFDVLTLEGSINARNHQGGTAPAQVKNAVTNARTLLSSR